MCFFIMIFGFYLMKEEMITIAYSFKTCIFTKAMKLQKWEM